MRRSKFLNLKPKIQTMKKTKVQFSTRLIGFIGEHQFQEFFEKVSITRQSGMTSKKRTNLNNKKSNSFRQTLQLNVPFTANLSESKDLCICYPVHFFRRKLPNFDSESTRFASVRIYFPANRMKYGNNLKVTFDLKKRYHYHPHPNEFVAYPSLLTLPLDDLALAVFRGKSLSENFKVSSSIPIPDLLLSSDVPTSQAGVPVFMGTERLYSRLLKLQALINLNAPQLSMLTNTDVDMNVRTCLLRWIGLNDFLPLSSRLVFVKRVSSDSGPTISSNVLNSPGPKLRRCKTDGDHFSIRLKSSKNDSKEEDKDSPKNESVKEKHLNLQSGKVKKPRGRPKKTMQTINTSLKMDNIKNDLDHMRNKSLSENNVNRSSISVKRESTSNSLTDSTSEEILSFQLSACSTPETIKNSSPLATDKTVASRESDKKCVPNKNKRGRPRKYPLKKEVSTFSKCNSEIARSPLPNSSDKSTSNQVIKEDRKRTNDDDVANEFRNKMSRMETQDGQCEPNKNVYSEKVHINGVQTIWTPLLYPLQPPDPSMPSLKFVSSTGLKIDNNRCLLKKTEKPENSSPSPGYSESGGLCLKSSSSSRDRPSSGAQSVCIANCLPSVPTMDMLNVSPGNYNFFQYFPSLFASNNQMFNSLSPQLGLSYMKTMNFPHLARFHPLYPLNFTPFCDSSQVMLFNQNYPSNHISSVNISQNAALANRLDLSIPISWSSNSFQ